MISGYYCDCRLVACFSFRGPNHSRAQGFLVKVWVDALVRAIIAIAGLLPVSLSQFQRAKPFWGTGFPCQVWTCGLVRAENSTPGWLLQREEKKVEGQDKPAHNHRTAEDHDQSVSAVRLLLGSVFRRRGFWSLEKATVELVVSWYLGILVSWFLASAPS